VNQKKKRYLDKPREPGVLAGPAQIA
jgi:hypothetical protein